VAVAKEGDTATEPDETFSVNLVTVANATIADIQGIGTIGNDDVTPVLTINDLTMTEGNNPNQRATFLAGLNVAGKQAITVNYATADDTAKAGSDYQTVVGVLTSPAGVRNTVLTIPIIGETLNELNERFYVNLSNPLRCTLARSQIACTLLNDDLQPRLSINDVSVTEGNAGTSDAVFTVRLSSAGGQNATVNYPTMNGNAMAGSDYIAQSRSLTFPPGATIRTISVAVKSDTNSVVSVGYTPFDGTATGGLDYLDASGTLLFAPREIRQSIRVPILADPWLEEAEMFRMQLVDPMGGAGLGVPHIVDVIIHDAAR
jgi:hypothetical protein